VASGWARPRGWPRAEPWRHRAGAAGVGNPWRRRAGAGAVAQRHAVGSEAGRRAQRKAEVTEGAEGRGRRWLAGP
jgi:hypothetical protein